MNVVADNSTDTVTFTLNAAYSQPLVHVQRAEPGHAAPDRLGHLQARWLRLVRAAARSAAYTSVTTAMQTIKGTPTLVQTSAAAKDCAAVYAFLTGKTERRRPWHLRHEPALADRGRALQA